MFEKGHLITAEELAFYHTYKNARVMVDLGGGRKQEVPIVAMM